MPAVTRDPVAAVLRPFRGEHQSGNASTAPCASSSVTSCSWTGSASLRQKKMTDSRASASRPSGQWNDDEFDVLANGVVVDAGSKILST